MKKSKKKYLITIEKTGTGYSANVDNFPVFTTGKNIEQLSSNILESLNFYLEDQNEYADFQNILLKLDFRLFFQNYRVLNAKILAKRIGMNPSLFSQYVQGKRELSSKQLKRITQGIHDLGEVLKELSLISSWF